MDYLNTLLQSAENIILVVLATFAVKYVASGLGVLVDKLLTGMQSLLLKINENKYVALAQFDEWLHDRLVSIILGVKDSVVDSLKAASADGKLTKPEIEATLTAAYKAFMDSLNTIERDQVVRILGEDAERIIKARIPGLVAGLKPHLIPGVASLPESLGDIVIPTVDTAIDIAAQEAAGDIEVPLVSE